MHPCRKPAAPLGGGACRYVVFPVPLFDLKVGHRARVGVIVRISQRASLVVGAAVGSVQEMGPVRAMTSAQRSGARDGAGAACWHGEDHVGACYAVSSNDEGRRRDGKTLPTKLESKRNVASCTLLGLESCGHFGPLPKSVGQD